MSEKVVLKFGGICGPEIGKKVTAKITKIRHFKAKIRFFGSFSAICVVIGLILGG